MGIMTNLELAKKHEEVAKKYKTIYAWGCFGMPCTQQILNEKKAQYPDWYTSRWNMYQQKVGTGTFLFDCVNLTKGDPVGLERQQKRLLWWRKVCRKWCA